MLPVEKDEVLQFGLIWTIKLVGRDQARLTRAINLITPVSPASESFKLKYQTS